MEKLPIKAETFVEKVKEKVKVTFADMIPDEAWDEMIKTEIDSFFKEGSSSKFLVKKENSGWGGNTTHTIKFKENVSPFRAVVWDYCFEETQKILKKDVISKMFTENQQDYSEEFKKISEEVMPVAIAKFFSGIVNNMRLDMQNQIINMQLNQQTY